MNYRVIGDKILVRRDPMNDELEVEGALLLPEKVVKPPRSGTIVTVGEEVSRVQAGERIFFSEYAGHFLKTGI